ncbi:hypothetical protein L2E82_48888 [Cichorium intybus]|uniref:Uncharacterized protein n=1 Tax=Cichorium intybus TaxID=13427 RepID=A0ACB8Z0E3_CICIN|nr:hypothetical protein L2E82_48888 [Cichorium intybus]
MYGLHQNTTSLYSLPLTEQQVHAWSMDANQYVADEDENTYSCVSGSLLLEEIVISCGIKGVYAILNAAKQRLDESQQQRVKGSVDWWRMREATLFAVSSVSEQLLEVEVSRPSGVNLGNLLEQTFTKDMAAGVHEFPFLYARMFSSIAKFSTVNAPTDVVKVIYEVCFDPVVRTVLQSDDHGEMQNATQCLAALVSCGKQQLLTWGGDPGYTMICLLDVASRSRKFRIRFC